MFAHFASVRSNKSSSTVGADRARLCVPLLLTVFFCALPIAGSAEAVVAVNRASASIDFRVIIPVVVHATGVRPVANILIDANDISRGYVEINADSARLTTNSRNGYQVTARHDAQLLSGVDVEMSGQQLAVREGAGSMRVIAGRGSNQPVPIRYRLHLASGVVPGNYRWPVALQFSNPAP